MKSLRIVLIGAVVAGSLVACNNDDKTAESTDKDTTTTTTTTVPNNTTTTTTTITVPDNTRTSFEAKYPNAANVNWVRRNRDESVTTTSQDSMDYMVTYRWNEADYTTWYDWDGDWMVTTAKIASDKVPAAVNSAITKLYDGYTVTEVELENDKNMTMYEVDLEKGTEKKTVKFTADGKEVKSKSKTK